MKKIFDDEVTDAGSDFGKLFEQHEKMVNKKVRVGDVFKGEILTIGKDDSFVSTGTTQDAIIYSSLLKDESGNLKHKVGDLIEVVVASIKGGEIRATIKGAKGASSDVDSLEDAFDMELPVEGKVIESIKGGFKVQINNKSAFCPISQIDLKSGIDASEYIGRKFEFLITQYENNGRNLVVSRRKVLDQERSAAEGVILESKKIGEIVDGTVSRLDKFGAFVNIGNGVEGLVHISEIGWSRLKDPSEVLSVGQKVSVKILKIEDSGSRLKISLSIKQADGAGNPWLQIFQNYPKGSVHQGKVEKKEQYGLFINIGPGVTGLLPRSKWKESLEASSYENKKKDDLISVQIENIDLEQKRISLVIPGEQDDLSWKDHASKAASFGTLADLFKK